VNPVDNRVDVTLENPPKARPGDTIPVTIRLRDPQKKPLRGRGDALAGRPGRPGPRKEQRLDPIPDFLVDARSRLTVRDTRSLVFGHLPFAEQPGGSGGEGEAGRPLREGHRAPELQAGAVLQPGDRGRPDGVATVQVRAPRQPDQLQAARQGDERPPALRPFATGEVAVRLPVIVQPALPRFVRPGDKFTAAGIGRIVEGEGGPGKAQVAAEGATITGPDHARDRVGPDRPSASSSRSRCHAAVHREGKLSRDESPSRWPSSGSPTAWATPSR